MPLKHANYKTCPLCEEKLKLAHEDLGYWFHNRVKPYWPDAHISWSHRDKENQERAFKEGKTTLHFPDSLHNKLPAMALDLFQINEKGLAVWDKMFFGGLARLIKNEGWQIRWGGDWETFKDYGHFEMNNK